MTGRWKTNWGYLKYVASFILMVLALRGNDKKYFLFSVLELLAIILLSNGIQRKKLRIAVNGILCLLFNSQMGIYLFGKTWLTMIMLTNLDSWDELSGQLPLYITVVVVVILISFIPVQQVRLPLFTSPSYLALILALELACAFHFGNGYSPMNAYIDIVFQYRDYKYQQAVIANMRADAGEFYNEGIMQFVEKPETLSKKPNVVMIFTEGLSQDVVDDPRGIMENVAEYQGKSLNFSGYYNHTIATYRGLVGQLCSGHQFDNFDVNTLISFQEILQKRCYDTTFINVEPKSDLFTDYVANLGFDQVIGDSEETYNGANESIADKDAYELLWNTMEEKQKDGKPYMLAIYTLGTHVSLDSPNMKYGDGTSAELNKFYDADHWFGDFMNKFENSPISDDTIVIYTADHCAYEDNYFDEAFPDANRTYGVLAEIPFFIYHKGIEPQTIEVHGRNSLDMVPTVCDYMDIDEPNYFWGLSLFGNDDSKDYYDTIFYNPDAILSSENEVLEVISQERAVGFMDRVMKYFAVVGE